ncbi:MAG: MiaB/RimO family radical SAM methylthiotransferase [bacterium]
MKYYIITYGCQMNESDSEKIVVLLQRQGHRPAKSEADANLIVLNACSVRQAAMHRVYSKINQYSGKKKVILAGCVLQKDKNALKEKVSEIWHPDSYFECPSVSLRSAPPAGGALKQSRTNTSVHGIATLPPVARNDATPAYVPIMTGCNNFCSYCAVPYTRGRERSRPADEIIAEVKALVKKGHKEIMLLGQNVNSYKSNSVSLRGATSPAGRRGDPDRLPPSTGLLRSARNDVNFAVLLKIINSLPGNFRLSFMTSHPKDMSDKLIATMAKCEKLAKNLHLPIQSGDNTILRKMNRHYTTNHYLILLKKIRKAIPDIKISTDIIVGFPGETKKQFQSTVALAKKAKFSGAFVAKYSPRPGTAAAKLKDNVPVEEKKRRWRILDTLINKFEH